LQNSLTGEQVAGIALTTFTPVSVAAVIVPPLAIGIVYKEGSPPVWPQTHMFPEVLEEVKYALSKVPW
jgi:hypothetical protein